MAERKSASSADAGQSEAQNIYDEAVRKGYFGTVADGPPNEAYSIKSGPDAPTPFEETVAASEQRLKDAKASPSQEVK